MGLENTEQSGGLVLSSSRSIQVSLAAVRSGNAGLDAHRQRMLEKTPSTGDWASFERDSIELKDLACLLHYNPFATFL